MNTSLRVFDFKEAPVRVHLAETGEPWWFAVDVCRSLGLGNAREALRGLDEDERLTVSNPDGQTGHGGAQSFNLVNESGLYSLIFRSRKPDRRAHV